MIFPKLLQICDLINRAMAFTLLYFITLTLISNIRSTRFSLRLHILHGAKPGRLDEICLMLYHGNERWTVNLVPAWITRRSGAHPSITILCFNVFRNVRSFDKKCHLFETTRVYRTFLWHSHLAELSALSKSSIHYLKQSCHSFDHLSRILSS